MSVWEFLKKVHAVPMYNGQCLAGHDKAEIQVSCSQLVAMAAAFLTAMCKQAQTAECLVVGEIAIPHMVVVLNKIDLLPAENRAKLLAKARKRLAQTFAATKFAGCSMLAVSSLPGGAMTPPPPPQPLAPHTPCPHTLGMSALSGLRRSKHRLSIA